MFRLFPLLKGCRAFSPGFLKTHFSQSFRRAVCLSNNSQISIGLIKYINNNNSFLYGNATLHHSWGMDSTYWVPGNEHYGLAILLEGKYLATAEVLYCPSWKHPSFQYGGMVIDDPYLAGVNTYGGFPKPGGVMPFLHVGISYGYRSIFGSGYKPANLLKADNPQEVRRIPTIGLKEMSSRAESMVITMST